VRFGNHRRRVGSIKLPQRPGPECIEIIGLGRTSGIRLKFAERFITNRHGREQISLAARNQAEVSEKAKSSQQSNANALKHEAEKNSRRGRQARQGVGGSKKTKRNQTRSRLLCEGSCRDKNRKCLLLFLSSLARFSACHGNSRKLKIVSVGTLLQA